MLLKLYRSLHVAKSVAQITPGVQNTPSVQHDVVVDKNAQVQPSQSQGKTVRRRT